MPPRPYQTITSRALRAVVLVLTLVAVSGALTIPASQAQETTVHLYYFYDPNCSVCEEIHQVLESLLVEYGDRIAVDERDISNMANFELLLALEAQFEVQSPSIPEVFIGADALIGPEEIRTQLQERIKYYLAQAGVDPGAGGVAALPSAATRPGCDTCEEIKRGQRALPSSRQTAQLATPTAVGAATLPIHAAWFYQPGCDLCERKEHDLQYLLDKYPQVKVQRFSIEDDMALNQYLCLRANVPEDRQLIAPAIFVGDSYLVGDEIRGSTLIALIQPYLGSGAEELWADWQANEAIAEQTILDRFRAFGIWTVVGAGLLDGLNPCAFATMIFLVSYLSVRKRQGRELLATGAAFTAGVFLAYLGVGFGFLKFLTSLPALSTVGKWIYGLTLVLCLGLAWGSFNDYRKASKGQLGDMSLKLPDRMRGWIRRLIREGSRARNYVSASLILGFVVSIVELACTGQVYLPTIIFVLGLPDWRVRATLALLAYNIMFVVPLIVVFLLVYYGTTSQQLTEWMARRAAPVKLGTAVLFVLLAGWLGYSIITL